MTIQVSLPFHLRNLAGTGESVELEIEPPVSLGKVLDTLESRYPVLRGTIREHDTLRRRPFIRYFACEEDLSHEPLDTLLPDAVLAGEEPLLIVGAMAGG